MSRVFVAEDRVLGRKVVVKVLPPELTAGVNVERFNREILVAAKLQHPHIVPVLAAGEMDGLPWFTMPFVEGESLRVRLERGTALSITEVVGLLRDVAKALAFAHEHGIVHRDIKPDNVLITGGSATVADFGIAKAISAARTEGSNATLTQVGTSIGTPAYMAPEQAAGDPETDHRADLYSFGCLAYELLAGRPPFLEKSPRKMLAAHMGERPQPIGELRPDTPVALAEAVMRCLEKEADARPQQARDVVRVLETVTTGEGSQAAMPAVLLAGRGMLKRALAIWAAVTVVVAIVAQAAVVGVGLPTWVLPGALVVMTLGLPVILWTAYVHRVARQAYSVTPTFTPGGTPSMQQGTIATIALKASPHMSWRRTARGGIIAMGAFVVVIAGYMILRALGIGPEGSLFARGMLSERDRLIMTDFTVSGADSALGRVVGDAVRSGLAQSRVLVMLSPSEVGDGLRRMQRNATSRVDLSTARALALRDGVKGIVDGDVTAVAGSYIITVRLMTADSARELASYRATAAGPGEVVGVADALARRLRTRAGESLRAVNASPRLERAITSSLEALRKYSEATRANDVEQDYDKAARLLREAVTIDSTFVEGWRKLGVALSNGDRPPSEVNAALERAFALRSMLPENTRLYLEAYYFGSGPGADRARAAAAYERLLALGDSSPLNNLAIIYYERREWARADSALRRLVARSPSFTLGQVNSYALRFFEADIPGMDSVAAAVRLTDPTSTVVLTHPVERAVLVGDVDGLRTALAATGGELWASPTGADYRLAELESRLGRSREARRILGRAIGNDSAAGRIRGAVIRPLALLGITRGSGLPATEERRALEQLLDRGALEAIENVEDRPYLQVAGELARVGNPARARAVLARYDAEVREERIRRSLQPGYHAALGAIAEAEGRWADAARELRKSDSLPDGPAGWCEWCLPIRLSEMFAAAGMADSAIAQYDAYRATPMGRRPRAEVDLQMDTPTVESLARAFEQVGDTARAIEMWREVTIRWANADPEFQSRVAAARRRLEALTPVERARR
jgi:tRNA A-37 threonylcarbamoyl transferase component Bud32/tetratricopeptide (TPR) repeat protein